jgi:hypothetical protein
MASTGFCSNIKNMNVEIGIGIVVLLIELNDYYYEKWKLEEPWN